MLVTINVVPLLIYFVLWGKLADRLGTTDWGRMFMMACATLRHVSVDTSRWSINNHLAGRGYGAALTLYLAIRITVDRRARLVVLRAVRILGRVHRPNELPALSLLCA